MPISESPGHGSPGLSCMVDPGFSTLEPEPEPAESDLAPRALDRSPARPLPLTLPRARSGPFAGNAGAGMR